VALAMIVAGKLGLYSLLRFHIGLFPAQARDVAPMMVGLAVVGILYGASLALVQRDFWRLMAFAALSHLSLVTLGIYGLTLTGWEGAVYQILNNGLVEGALFLLLGVLHDSYATSEITEYGGLARKLPRTATFFVIASLAMIGLPMLGNFVGEFLILLGTFTGVSKGWAIAATMGVILGAAYMLWLIQRLFFGPESELAVSKPPGDLRAGQMAVMWPLAVMMLAMGVAPGLWLPTIEKGARLLQPTEQRMSTAVAPKPVPPPPATPASPDEEGQR
jgi:NADH-quinone oxidoreductase subunit M